MGKTVFPFNQKLNAKALIFHAVAIVLIIHTYNSLFLNRAVFHVHFVGGAGGIFQIFWADENQPFSEKQSRTIRTTKSNDQYALYIGSLKHIKKLRIDPLKSKGEVRITHLGITQDYYQSMALDYQKGHAVLTPGNHIERLEPENGYLVVRSSGIDPHFYWDIEPEKIPDAGYGGYIAFIAGMVLCWLLANFLARPFKGFGWIGPLLCIAVCFMAAMAYQSPYNKHPDEYVHVAAGKYYETHWAPPEICKAGTEDSYSVYGTSRLNSKEVVYFLAGKFSALTKFIPVESHIRLRFFNVLLFAALVVLFFKNRDTRVLFLPLIMTPQIWYIFSYFNSDAFSLFISLLICHQIIYEKSLFREFINTERAQGLSIKVLLVLGLLSAVFLHAKKNFYILVIFFSMFILAKYWRDIKTGILRYWRPIAMIMVVTLGYLVMIEGMYIQVNGINQKQKIIECKNKIALYEYKPSTPLEEKNQNIYLKRRGFPISYVLTNGKWAHRILRSSFGVYGYTNISAHNIYYDIFAGAFLFFLVCATASVLLYSSWNERFLWAITVSCCFLMISITLYRAWYADLQAQGRYLLPIIPMISFLCYYVKDAIDNTIVRLAAFILFAISTYSFLWVGIQRMI
jgi:hypothetical protein